MILLLLLIILSLVSPLPLLTTVGSQSLPHCPGRCGDVNISYPFGILDGCSKTRDFLLTCNTTYTPPRPFWRDVYEVLEISIPRGEILLLLPTVRACYDKTTKLLDSSGQLEELTNTPFTYSDLNRFTLTGCATTAYIQNGTEQEFIAACASACSNKTTFPNNTCSGGVGCCQASIPGGLTSFNLSFGTYFGLTGVADYNPCSFAFVAEPSRFLFNKSIITAHENYTMKVPVVLDWYVEREPCPTSVASSSSCISQKSECARSKDGLGHLCNCSKGYEGNPYVQDGCQDIDECSNKEVYPCFGVCTNTPGGYECVCRPGYQGNATTYGGCFKDNKSMVVTGIVAGICGALGFLMLLGGSGWLYKVSKNRRAMKLRAIHRYNNLASLSSKLEEYYGAGAHEVRTFSLTEMDKATDNFDRTRIVGSGGQGTVYKGLLPDKRVAAIKRFEKPPKDGKIEREHDQFINEIAILSRIDHRNVVKLLGCCLETEVPMLVYEFISNGTLFQQLNVWERSACMPWDDRLRIAAEIAGAMTYLHSAASRSIFHRDLKTANILLDEKLTAKVSDFGASKSIVADETHVTTRVQGTFGYMDPEYFQTGALSEKSDVYSLGVILVELLTGQKPISQTGNQEGTNLVTSLSSVLKENQVSAYVEVSIVQEGKMDEALVVARLAEACVKLTGAERPTMREVEAKLQGLRRPVRKQVAEEVPSRVPKMPEHRVLLPSSSNSDTTETGTVQFQIKEKFMEEEKFLR